MADKFHHESLYRGHQSIARLADVSITVCGAGALGSNLVDNLVRQGFARLRVIDHDRIEQHNINTQVYGQEDVGACKTDVLANRVFRSVGVEIETVRKELCDRNVGKLLRNSDIVIDTFDNAAARQSVQRHCRASATRCLHVGLFEDYGEVIWDAQYRVPCDTDQDVCDYPLARNLVLLTVAIASESIMKSVLEETENSWTVTLGDFAVRQLSAPLNVG